MSATLGQQIPPKIATFDLETTGVDVEEDRIVTAFVGVMDTATGEWVDQASMWSWLINPGVEIPEGATAVHGITTARAREDGMDPDVAVFEIVQRLDILARAGIPLVAMNAIFDFTILDRELARYWPNVRPLLDRELLTEEVVRPTIFDPMVVDRTVDKWRKGKRTLVDLAAHYRVPVEENAHDAAADCLMAGRIAIKLLHHPRLAGASIEEVHARLIYHYRANSESLADYWESKILPTLPQAERAAKIVAIADVRAKAGCWPCIPRPTITPETEEASNV